MSTVTVTETVTVWVWLTVIPPPRLTHPHKMATMVNNINININIVNINIINVNVSESVTAKVEVKVKMKVRVSVNLKVTMQVNISIRLITLVHVQSMYFYIWQHSSEIGMCDHLHIHPSRICRLCVDMNTKIHLTFLDTFWSAVNYWMSMSMMIVVADQYFIHNSHLVNGVQYGLIAINWNRLISGE